MKKYSSGIVHIFVLIILALVVVGGIGYWVYKSGYVKLNSPQQGAILVPTPDSAANWKIYTNKKYGFSFDYPPEAILTTDGENNLLVSLDYQDPSTSDKGAYGVLGWLIRVYEMENVKSLSISDFFEEQKISNDPYIDKNTIETTQFAEKPAIYWETDMGGVVNNYYIETGNGILLFQYNVFGAKQEHRDAVDQILSTFKFIE